MYIYFAAMFVCNFNCVWWNNHVRVVVQQNTKSATVDSSETVSVKKGADVDSAVKKPGAGMCIDLEMIDAVDSAADISTALAKIDIAAEEAAPARTACDKAADAGRTFGTDITTTPTKSFKNVITPKDILSASKSFAMTPSGKIKCSYTGHEMPATAEAVGMYMSGKKYRKAKMKAEFSIDEFQPWIIETDSAENPNQVWCTVTKRFVSRDAKIIRRHMAGKKFIEMLEKLQNFEMLRGVPTPKGKHTVFDSPKNTPRSNPYTYNVHWTMEDYWDLWVVNLICWKKRTNPITTQLNKLIRSTRNNGKALLILYWFMNSISFKIYEGDVNTGEGGRKNTYVLIKIDISQVFDVQEDWSRVSAEWIDTSWVGYYKSISCHTS